MNTPSRSSGPILFFSTMEGASWAGSEELWFETAMRMLDRGWPIAASMQKWPQPADQLTALRKRGVPVIERGVPSAPMRLLHKIHPGQKYSWLRKINPRFIFLSQGASWSEGTIEAGEAILSCGAPYAMVSHCAYPWYWPPDHNAARMRRIFNNARVSYFVSKANLALTRMQTGDPMTNARIVRNPFKVDYDEPLPWPNGDNFRLAYPARLEPGVKGHDLLFQALSGEVWRNRKLTVTLYGRGDHAEIVRSLQKSFDVPNVVFGGFVEPREMWRQNHAMVLSSRAEGLPVVLVEAMLCGRPAILTDVGGNSEVVEDGVTGFLAREATARGIGDALERAWQRRDQWKSMGECAGKRIREKIPRDPAGILVRELEEVIPR